MLSLPPGEQPRLILPASKSSGARHLARALYDGTGLPERMRRGVLQAATWLGVRSKRLANPPLFDAVVSHLPQSDYLYGVRLGPPRANRKPVMAVAEKDGDVVAFAKLGVDALTDELVRCEANALTQLPRFQSVNAPRLIGEGDLRSHSYSVMTPVPQTRASAAADNDALVAQAMVEVAAVGNCDGLGEYAKRLVASWAGHGEPLIARRWTELAVPRLPAGSWHGDWRRTNMAVNGARVSLWDWERFETGVPVGYDALHLHLTDAARHTDHLAELPRLLRRDAPTLLKPFGYDVAEDIELVVLGYLLHLASRYLDDDQLSAGARLGDVQRWLLPYVRERLGEASA